MKREIFDKARGVDDEINRTQLMLRKVEKLRGYYSDTDRKWPEPTVKIAGEDIDVSIRILRSALETMSEGLKAETAISEHEFEEL